MKITTFLCVCFLASCWSSTARAQEKPDLFSISFGESKDGITIYRFAMYRDFSGWLQERGIPLSGHFESSMNYWRGFTSEIYGIAVSPVFVYSFCEDCSVKPYVDAGVGLSLISNTTIDNRNMASLFHFEDRFGIGIEVNNIDIHFRYMHYSNAGMVQPNDGIDIFIGGVAFSL